MHREIKYKKNDTIKVCDHMNKKMKNYETGVIYPWHYAVGTLITFLFLLFLFTGKYLISLIFIVGIFMLASPLFCKVRVDEEGVSLITKRVSKTSYEYSDIKKIEIKGRRLKMKMNEDLLDPGMLILFNPKKVKEGIKKYRSELLE